MEERVENRNLCKECGGYCCKKSGCDYFVSDFENMKMDYLEEVLSTGRVSIVAALKFARNKNGKLYVDPLLYMRARNIGREEIDLFSLKTTCASLTDSGCYFDLEHRPGGGAALIPKYENGHFACYSEVDRMKELNRWKPYQTILQKLVKKHTGMDVYNRLRYDVENVFYDILTENFENVAEAEIRDILSEIRLLREAYPEEFLKARARKEKVNILVMKKTK